MCEPPLPPPLPSCPSSRSPLVAMRIPTCGIYQGCRWVPTASVGVFCFCDLEWCLKSTASDQVCVVPCCTTPTVKSSTPAHHFARRLYCDVATGLLSQSRCTVHRPHDFASCITRCVCLRFMFEPLERVLEHSPPKSCVGSFALTLERYVSSVVSSCEDACGAFWCLCSSNPAPVTTTDVTSVSWTCTVENNIPPSRISCLFTKRRCFFI